MRYLYLILKIYIYKKNYFSPGDLINFIFDFFLQKKFKSLEVFHNPCFPFSLLLVIGGVPVPGTMPNP